jgi:Rieske Fe-S protein
MVAGKSATIIGRVTEKEAPTSGTAKDGNEYTNQRMKVVDESGVTNLILWGEDVNTLDSGKYYRFEDFYVKDYKGHLQIEKGKFGSLHLADEKDMLPADPQTTFPTSDGPHVSNVAWEDNQGSLDKEIENAEKVLQAYIKACQDQGCATPEGTASVWNTMMMRRGK